MLIDLPFEFSIYPESAIGDSLMSAISVVYTNQGFILAADGRRSLTDDAPESAQCLATDNAQKIYPIEDQDRVLAYGIVGLAGSDDGQFDIYVESEKEAKRLSTLPFSDLWNYTEEFCRGLNKAFNLARKQGRFPKGFPKINRVHQSRAWQIAAIGVAGYFQGMPAWQLAEFFHHENLQCEFRLHLSQIRPGSRMLFGSNKIREFTYPMEKTTETDPRFASYIKPTGPNTSLEGAVDIARGFIEAHTDAVALQEDYAFCRTVGGHIHVAEITPEGFRWRVPPKNN